MMARRKNQALIITKESALETSLSVGLNACDLDPVCVSELKQAVIELDGARHGCIVLDLDSVTDLMSEFVLHLQKNGGLDRLVLLISEASLSLAVTAMRAGAQWHLRKPVPRDELRLVVERLEQTARSQKQAGDDTVYGSSPEIQSVLKVMDLAAERDEHVTIHGEPGSGKRLFARLLHRKSRRRDVPLVNFSCAGLSERVTDADLFGSRKAVGGPEGILETCRGGTLFFDEIDLLQVNIQRKLFNYLKENGFGLRGVNPRDAVRLIAASSRNLERRVHEGRFHVGLFDLVDSVRIYLPPLRERKSDIPILVDQFLRRASESSGRTVSGIAPEAMVRLMRYDWPGNVRELRDLIGHAVGSGMDSVLGPESLPSLPEPLGPQSGGFPERATIQEIEREAILRTLESTGGSTSRAARILNMSVRKIQYKLKEYRGDAGSALRVERVRAVAASRTGPAKKTEFLAEPRSRN